MRENADYWRPTDPAEAARWDAGYESLTEHLHGESLAFAKGSCLEFRLATLDNRIAFNRGGNAAARDYVAQLEAQHGDDDAVTK